MAKAKISFVCSVCGYESVRWYGKCPDCGQWNTMEESAATENASVLKPNKRPKGTGADALALHQIDAGAEAHEKTGIEEFDRVLGGGVVEGSMLLIGGEPGVGKSTLLLQVCANLSGAGRRVLYISGEESARQIKLRAKRLGAGNSGMLILAENAMDAIEEKLNEIQPDYVVIDSIQTMYRPDLAGAPGSVSQVRECATILMRYAKTSGSAVLLVGHVTKEGEIAGPRVLEHMVDVVLYFEGDHHREYRLLRAVKNRFGSVNELGVFEMTEKGMIVVENPSETMLKERVSGVSGSVVFCGMEGSRPMLMDIQALVTPSFYASPRRTVNGMDYARIALLLAVLEKRVGLRLYNQDVYINVAGGMSLNEPAADLAVCLAVASSLADRPLPKDYVVMGEVGLVGEVRAIPQLKRRLQEASRLGFHTIVCPKEREKAASERDGEVVIRVSSVAQAVAAMHLYAEKRKVLQSEGE